MKEKNSINCYHSLNALSILCLTGRQMVPKGSMKFIITKYVCLGDKLKELVL